jgi:hypothetical protein
LLTGQLKITYIVEVQEEVRIELKSMGLTTTKELPEDPPEDSPLAPWLRFLPRDFIFFFDHLSQATRT